MSNEEFYIKKIVALFHDPPHKAYVLSRGRMLSQKNEKNECIILIGQSWKKVGKKRAHECDALQLFVDIFLEIFKDPATLWKRYYKSIKEADILASAIDRYITSLLYHSAVRESYVDYIKLKNVFWPLSELDLNPTNDEINEYTDKINNEYKKDLKNIVDYVWKNLSDVTDETERLKELYQVLYLLYELLWIDRGLKLTPADTRVPTHTIFDHLYATAAISNIINQTGSSNLEYHGYLLGIDVVGVNDFISKSRKVRDMWISSYLVSALLWYVIIYFVEKYGPDVVIFPSLRFNQFYAYYILNKLREKCRDCDSVISEIKTLITKYIFNNEDPDELGIPSYPIIPGRVTLILPEEANEDESFVVQKLKEGWKNLLRALQLYIEETDKAEMKELGKAVCVYFPLMEDNPPIRIRVKKIEISGSTRDRWRLYNDAYRKLVSEFKKAKAVRIYSESTIDLQNAISSNRGYEVCTSCGLLPAVVIGEEEKGIVSKGERLCPVCLTKRLLGFEPRLLTTLLLGKSKEIAKQTKEFFVPSDSLFTSIELLKELKKRLNDPSFVQDFEKECSVSISNRSSEIVSNWKFLNNLRGEKVENLIVNYTPEELWFNPEKPECQRFLKERRLKIPSPYYAIVRADGDYLGDLLEGKLSPYFSGLIDSSDYKDITKKKELAQKFLSVYMKSSTEGLSRSLVDKFIDYVMSEDQSEKDKLKQDIVNCEEKATTSTSTNRIEKSVESSIRFFSQILNEAKIIVTPAWHVAISAALNRSLLKEIELVNKHNGFVIYAGGDDLLAFLPVSNVVYFILECRGAFYGEYEIGNKGESSNAKPFYKLNEAEYPQLAVIGRSYSVILGKYKDPLSFLVKMSYDILENGKEKIYFEKNIDQFKKDVAFFVYQGSISYISLFTNRLEVVEEMSNANINIGEVLETLKDLYEMIKNGKLSTSLLYDYDRYKELIKHADDDKLRQNLIHEWLLSNIKKRGSSSAEDNLEETEKQLLELSKIKTIDKYTSRKEDILLTQVILTLKFLLGVA